MFKRIIEFLFKDFYLFSAAYSNELFPEPLSKEEEAKCLAGLKEGNKDCRNKLIEHNLRLVAHIVKKYEHNVGDLDDLISIGTIGLIKGIDSYSGSHGTKLTTYVARCVENEILMHFRSSKKTSKNISLDDQLGYDKDGNEVTLMDVLKTPDPEYDMKIYIKDNIEKLKKYFSVLNERELNILIKRYGLNNTKSYTQKEIAKSMNISRSYVSRIEKRALTKLFREFSRMNDLGVDK